MRLKYTLLLTILLCLNACQHNSQSQYDLVIPSYNKEVFEQDEKGIFVVFCPSIIDKSEVDCRVEITAKITNVIDESKTYGTKIIVHASEPVFFVGMMDPGIYYIDSVSFKPIGNCSDRYSSTCKTSTEMFSQSNSGTKITSTTQERKLIKLGKPAIEVKSKEVIFFGEGKLPFYKETQSLLKTNGYKNLADKLNPGTIGRIGSMIECTHNTCQLLKPERIQLLYEYQPKHWKRTPSETHK
ncbi:MAG: hypothetical protein K2W94_05080 [Alphaproteobacteria bacterium]|nr:hypothetical protein [Alphaproteobacteria bacterium]